MIQAVTAKDGVHSIQKEASEIGVGDIVFCEVQRSQQYYAHIVLDVERSVYHLEPKYWIGNIQRQRNGWCYREHIFGVLVRVQDGCEVQYYLRPHPKDKFETVQSLVSTNRWNRASLELCLAVEGSR